MFSFTAIRFDGVQVFGYAAWSLVDGFEWNNGFTVRRGLFYIDFSHPNRTRTPKTTAQYYRHVVADNGFPRDETSREMKDRFPCEFHWGIADSTLQVRRERIRENNRVILQQKKAKWMFIHPDMFLCLCCYCRCTSILSHHSLLTPICTAGTWQEMDHCVQSQGWRCTPDEPSALTTWPFMVSLACLRQLGHLTIALP